MTKVDGERDPLQVAFGQHLRSLRKARGLRQEDLALKGGVSADTIRRIENGGFSPSMSTVRRIAAGLELSVSRIMATFDSEEPHLNDLIAVVGGCTREEIDAITDVARLVLAKLREARGS